MRTDTLTTATATTHDELTQRLRKAEADTGDSDDPRIHFAHADTFLATASRRIAAVDAVLVPAARRHLEDGGQRAHEMVHRARDLELALAAVKAKLYGEAHAVHRPWPAVWTDVDIELQQYLELENSLVLALAEALQPQALDDLALDLHKTELTAPSRPHPYTPHTGVRGRIARSMWAKADRFWDAAEGRIIPEPPHPHHKPPGLLAQYVLADPRFDLEDPDGQPAGNPTESDQPAAPDQPTAGADQSTTAEHPKQ
jgi:hypothetical protein